MQRASTSMVRGPVQLAFLCSDSAPRSTALLDIMLGFLRSRLDGQEMMMQQRKAVSGILRWCESQDEVKVTGNTVRAAAGEHLDWVRAMSSE